MYLQNYFFIHELYISPLSKILTKLILLYLANKQLILPYLPNKNSVFKQIEPINIKNDPSSDL